MDELDPWIINIDEGKFRALWQKIGGNQERVPSVLLEEYPDEKKRKKDEMKKMKTLGLYRSDHNAIYIFYKNFNYSSYKNKDSFHKEIVNTLAHEVSHARLTQGDVGIRSLLHNSTSWIFKNLIILNIAALTLFFALTFLGFVSYLSLGYNIIFPISLSISYLATLVTVRFLNKLLLRFREAVTDSYASDLMSMHEDDFMNVVRVITLTDLFPKTAHGQFLVEYCSAAITARNLQQKSLN